MTAGLEARAKDLQREDPALLLRHAERIAMLEAEVAELRHQALTDPISRFLNQRAHLADCPASGSGHGVMEVTDLQAVYEHCGHSAGDDFMRDIAAIMRPIVEGRDARFYRIETAKFAAIMPTLEAAEELMKALKHALKTMRVSCKVPDGTADVARSATSVGQFLSRIPNAFGLVVRARPA